MMHISVVIIAWAADISLLPVCNSYPLQQPIFVAYKMKLYIHIYIYIYIYIYIMLICMYIIVVISCNMQMANIYIVSHASNLLNTLWQ